MLVIIILSIIIIILTIVIFIAFKVDIKRKTNKILQIDNNYKNKEKLIESNRFKNVIFLIKQHSYMYKLITVLNGKFNNRYYRKPDVKFSVHKKFYEKRQFDRASTYTYMINEKKRLFHAIEERIQYDAFISSYKKNIEKIKECSTPIWAIKRLNIDVSEFLKLEKEIFKSLIRIVNYSSEVTCYVLLEYTSPAGRNHYKKSITYFESDFGYNVITDTSSCKIILDYTYTNFPMSSSKSNNEVNIKIEEKNNIKYIESNKDIKKISLTCDKNVCEKYYQDRVDIKKIIILENVNKIGKFAFSGCCNLEEVIINSNNIEIDSHAFEGCYNLRIFKYSGVIYAHKDLFNDCYRLDTSSLKNIFKE